MIQNERKCVFKRKSFPKADLIRIAKTKENEYHVNSNIQGRGVYVSKDVSFAALSKRKILHKTFRAQVPESVYLELKEVLEGGQ